MVKVVDFKARAIERLEGYRDNPATLKGLVYARYASTPHAGQSFKGGKRVSLAKARFVPFAERKHKPHQMHGQHRESCIKLLGFLIRRLDVASRQCVFVNPARKIRRTLYVPEMARETGLCDRTVTRVLGAFVSARYLVRTANKFFLTLHLFRDLSLDVTLQRLTNQLQGLANRAVKATGSRSGQQAGAKPHRPSAQPGPQSPAGASEQPTTPLTLPSPESVAIGNLALASLRPRRRRPPS